MDLAQWLCLLGLTVPALVLGAALLTRDVGRGSSPAWTQAARALRGMRATRSCEAVGGRPTKIVGCVSAESELEAPLSGARCIGWRLVVEGALEWGRGWTVVHQVEAVADLLVDDGASVVRVRGAEDATPCVLWRERGPWVDATTPAVRALIESMEVSTRTSQPRDGARDRPLRLREERLERGDRIAVLGTAIWETDPDAADVDAAYRRAGRRLIVLPTAERPLVLSVRPEMSR